MLSLLHFKLVKIVITKLLHILWEKKFNKYIYKNFILNTNEGLVKMVIDLILGWILIGLM